MKSFWMFPGQGSQHAGMLASVPADEIGRVADVAGVQLDDQDYQDGVQVQLAILTLQMWQVDHLKNQGFSPTVVGGHSLGVFAAAYAAGVYDKDSLIQIVKKRAELMLSAYPTGYGMGVVVGLTRDEVEGLVAMVNSSSNPVFTSNQNAELQVAVSGKLTAVDQVLKLAYSHGASKAKRLKVPVLSHAPLMNAVADQLTEVINQCPVHDPQALYLANYNGHLERQVDEIKFDLGHNLAYPVFWDQMLDVATELDLDVAVEFSPGTVLSGLLSHKDSDLRRIPLDQYGIDDGCYLLEKIEKKQ